LLPNKFNAAVINDATHAGGNNNATSAAIHRAIKNSSRGAIKATKLAGDILTTKMTNLATMINSASGGRIKLALILPFQTHQIHGSNLTA